MCVFCANALRHALYNYVLYIAALLNAQCHRIGSHYMKKRKKAISYDDMLAEIRSQWKTKYRKL